jgi:hypothetical protein
VLTDRLKQREVTPGDGRLDVVLHVDGVGGFRVLAKPVISVGPAGGSRPPDVPLAADPALPTVTIARSDEDYFLHCRHHVLINEKRVVSKLLCHGDQIALSPRCRFAFRRPSPASASAVLDLSGTRLARGGVRQVILLDRELIVGAGPGVHIRCDQMPVPAVIQCRGGRLVYRLGGNATELTPGTHVVLGPIGIVVAKEE